MNPNGPGPNGPNERYPGLIHPHVPRTWTQWVVMGRDPGLIDPNVPRTWTQWAHMAPGPGHMGPNGPGSLPLRDFIVCKLCPGLHIKYIDTLSY